VDNIYREEYTREQARMDARRLAGPSPKKKNRLLRFAVPVFLGGFMCYTIFILGDEFGFSPTIFLKLDFVLAVMVLTGLFLLLLNS